mmetsp:Transcript_76255/g.120400  ORF Transcript_76255/g.120400 Transcript_76255/m.120400 type:complete len:118 (-) Transcript_76255:71-424(-)
MLKKGQSRQDFTNLGEKFKSPARQKQHQCVAFWRKRITRRNGQASPGARPPLSATNAAAIQAKWGSENAQALAIAHSAAAVCLQVIASAVDDPLESNLAPYSSAAVIADALGRREAV